MIGCKVAIGARRLEQLDAVAAKIRNAGGDVFAHSLDVTDAESVDRFFDSVEAEFGPVDVAVSNAGICVPGLLHEVAPEDMKAEILTNLLGPMYVARRCIPSMTRKSAGNLVFISSDNARAPRTFQASYSASKTGVEALARTLAMELEGSVETLRLAAKPRIHAARVGRRCGRFCRQRSARRYHRYNRVAARCSGRVRGCVRKLNESGESDDRCEPVSP